MKRRSRSLRRYAVLLAHCDEDTDKAFQRTKKRAVRDDDEEEAAVTTAPRKKQ